MQKKAGASPSGKAMATPSRKVPGVRRSFFVGSCHSRRKANSLPLCSERTVSELMVGSGRLGRVMTWPLSGTTIVGAVVQSGDVGAKDRPAGLEEALLESNGWL